MLVKDIMTKDVGGIIPESSIREAAHKMASLGVGFLPICNGEKIEGVITDRDIVVRAIATGNDPDKAQVRDFMSKKVQWIKEDEVIGKASASMKKNKIRRLLVLNNDKMLSGVISLGDIAVYADKEKPAARVLKEISTPAQPNRGV
ncbi:MAG TPA: CBS domain-containing protein [Candidatus Omnitrophota bacterium]|nr:CBS domain-containing protein [Candidatus Omnitrophota bacterium]